MGRKKIPFLAMVSMLLMSVQLSGCYYYAGPAPVVVGPAPATSSYDTVWNSAIRAAEDVGVQISSVDQGAGAIHGRRGPVDVRVLVTRQTDGRTRVELSMKGENQETQNLSNDFFAAYDRYMGRR